MNLPIIGSGTEYIADDELSFHFYSDYLRLIDLKNAFLKGKYCDTYTIGTAYHDDKVRAKILSYFAEFFDCNFRKMINHLSAKNWVKTSNGGFQEIKISEILTIHRSSDKGVNTFAPFHITRLKPLTKAPNKWTMSHAIRAIANRQYTDLVCDGIYTDDYYGDAEVNFRRGPIERMKFLKELVESSASWRVHADGNEININCHHFNCNHFIFKP